MNLGRVAPSLSRRHAYTSHRGVYLAAIQKRGHEQPLLRMIRMQKRGVWELLDQGKDMLTAIVESEEYTEHILDRRLACRQLGMNLPPHVTARKLRETYAGTNERYRGQSIWSTYFERDYIHGLATDKIPSCRFAEEGYAVAFARVLGRAAAPNLVVGRCDARANPVFDDGDELIIEDSQGMPADIMATDHTGTFMDCQRDLRESVASYAQSINKRAADLEDMPAFAEAFLESFFRRFSQIQHDYRKRRRAFDSLFEHQTHGQRSGFAHRWECALSRLENAEPRQLVEAIRDGLCVGSPY